MQLTVQDMELVVPDRGSRAICHGMGGTIRCVGGNGKSGCGGYG